MQILDCEQGSADWFNARAGIITASSMKDVLAKGQGKTRASYMHKLIGEIMTGNAMSNFTNGYTERGHELEPEAREIYQETHDVEVREVGFIRNHDDLGGVGYSPDGLAADDGCIEIKTREPHLQVELLLAGRMPPEHRAQVQCGLWVSERQWCDFVSYCPGLPLYVCRVTRDDEYIGEMQEAVTAFYAEMQEKLERLKSIGG